MSSTLFKPTFLYIKQHSVTGKLYLGKYTGNRVEKYYGSGKYWTDHLKIHGKDKVETLWYCLFLDKDSLTEMASYMSKEYDIVKSDKWANLVDEDGLMGGWSHMNKLRMMDPLFYSHRQSELMKLKWQDAEYSRRVSDKISKTLIEQYKNGRKKPSGSQFTNEQKLKSHSPESRKKMVETRRNNGYKPDTSHMNNEQSNDKRKATFAKNNHMQGDKNSQFGTCWVTNGLENKKIKKEELDNFISLGYAKGRKMM